MSRRERIERRLAEARRHGHEYPFGSGDGYRDIEPELRALWAFRDAAHAWRCDENAECDSASTLALCATLDAYEADGCGASLPVSRDFVANRDCDEALAEAKRLQALNDQLVAREMRTKAENERPQARVAELEEYQGFVRQEDDDDSRLQAARSAEQP